MAGSKGAHPGCGSPELSKSRGHHLSRMDVAVEARRTALVACGLVVPLELPVHWGQKSGQRPCGV